MFSSPVEEIKNRLNIVDVVGSYIKLQKTGANYRANCPFHSEKKPSFFVSPVRQIWHCFGCQKGGDIFGFVKEIEGVEFGDALRILAKKAGVELKRQDPELRTERQRLYEICDLTCRFFEKQLETSNAGKKAKEYLLGRGITEDSIKKWRLGYSPDTWRGLSDFLVSKGYNREEIVKAGLAVQKESQESFNNSHVPISISRDRATARSSEGFSHTYDRFRGRIIFPIFDLSSQPIGFGARVFGENKEAADKETATMSAQRQTGPPVAIGDLGAKYINTPATILYDKSRVLYGLDKGKVEVRKKDSCALVEGYTDVIMAHQAGFQNVAAVSGTALTPFQLRLLKRYSENLLTAFDMDIAGDSATKRGIDLALAQGFNVKVITMPKDEDPCDVISKDPQSWEKLLNGAKSILEFYFENALSGANPKTPEGKKEISKLLLPAIRKIPNKIEQSFWVQKLANTLEVREEDVREELKKTKTGNIEIAGGPAVLEAALSPRTKKDLLEERLLTLVLKMPENFSLLTEKDSEFFSPAFLTIIEYLKKKDNSLAGAAFVDAGLSVPMVDLLNRCSLMAEVEEFLVSDISREFKNCLSGIRLFEIKNKLDKISKEIKKAETGGDSAKTQRLLEEFNLLAKETNGANF